MTVTPFGSRSYARHGGTTASAWRARSTMVSRSTPISSATAVAHSTFIRWPRPSSGTFSDRVGRPA